MQTQTASLEWIDGVPGRDEGALSALAQRTFTDKFGHLYRPEDLSAFLEEEHSEEWYAKALADPDMLVRIGRAPNGAFAAYLVCSPLSLEAPGAPEGSVELKRVYVDKPFQGRGLGTYLIDEALAWATSRGAPAMYLSVYSENVAAQRLYDRLGWRKIGEFLFPVGEHRDLEFLLVKSL